MPGRLPDFVLVGTMKSGTTSLFRWLGEQPGCVLPDVKEPGFFGGPDRDLDHYTAHFDPLPRDARTGEASVIYTAPDRAPAAAAHWAATASGARLLCVLRHPIERLRSHHAHEVQRGRERAGLTSAATIDSVYARSSRYHACLTPWLDVARPDQLLVVRFEDLFGDDDAAWTQVLEHVGLPIAPRPGTAHNRSDSKDRFSPVMRRLWDRGVRRPPTGTPAVVRRLAKRVLLRPAMPTGGPVSAAVERAVWGDVEQLEERLGRGPLWSRPA